MIQVGMAVVRANSSENPPVRGRVIRYEGEDLGVRVWLVAWQDPLRGEQRLKEPEQGLQPL